MLKSDLLKALFNFEPFEISKKYKVSIETMEVWTGNKIKIVLIEEGMSIMDAKKKALNKFSDIKENIFITNIELANITDSPSIVIRELNS